MEYNLREISNLINKALTDNEFNDLLFYDFNDISVTQGMDKAQKMRLLLEYAKTKKEIEKLLDIIKEINPSVYSEYESKIKLSLYQEKEAQLTEYPLIKTIKTEEWNNLYSILEQITDNNLITLMTEICHKTLKNNHHDLLGNYLSLSKKIALENLQELLLKKFPKRKDDVPTLLEFAERLKNKLKNGKQLPEIYNKLQQWIIAVADRLNLTLPTYSESSVNQVDDDNFKYFLLIVFIPKGNQKFKLEPDLLRYQTADNSYEIIPKFIDSQKIEARECDITQMKDEITKIIDICENDYLDFPYDLYIELFLPCSHLGYGFEREKICLDQQRSDDNYLGLTYPLWVRSFDRINNKRFYNKFLNRWQTFVKPKLNDFCTLLTSLEYLESVDNYQTQTLKKMANLWEVNNVVGIKIMGCWPQKEQEQDNLFYHIIQSGIPMVLWSRSNELPDAQQQWKDLLELGDLQHWHDLFEKIKKSRQQAYEDEQKLGYHLGILVDDPQRIPSSSPLKPLIPTGK